MSPDLLSCLVSLSGILFLPLFCLCRPFPAGQPFQSFLLVPGLCLLPPLGTSRQTSVFAGCGTTLGRPEACEVLGLGNSALLAARLGFLYPAPQPGSPRHSAETVRGDVVVDLVARDAWVLGQETLGSLPFAEGVAGPWHGPVGAGLCGVLAEHVLLVGEVVGVDDLAEVAGKAHHGLAALLPVVHGHVLGF